MKIFPIYDRVLIRKLAAEERSKGGLIIPETAAAPGQAGIVLAIGQGRNYDGPGERLRVVGDLALLDGQGNAGTGQVERTTYARPKMVVKVGDKVIFGKFSGTQVELNGEPVFLCREDEILAVVVDEPGDETQSESEPEPGIPATH